MKKKFLTILFIFVFILISLFIMKFFLTHEHKIIYSDNYKIEDQDIFIVFHGIYGENKDLKSISKILSDNGYPVVNIQYPTTEGTIEEITEKYITPVVEKELSSLNKKNAERKKENKESLKINFIVHSMGSAVLRYYLSENKIENMGKVMFISPPSHGSHLSDNFISDALLYFIGPAVSQIKTDKKSLVNTLGEPDYPCYILIGDHSNNFIYSILIPGKDDGMIPLYTAKMDKCGLKIIKNTTHTSILESKDTFREVRNYFMNSDSNK